MMHIHDVGLVEDDVPLNLYPEKGLLWRRGFADGWALEKHAKIDDLVPPVQPGEYKQGWLSGRNAWLMTHNPRTHHDPDPS